ncbi:MAG TPA: nucleoside recognition protein [Firmicutes bacterium]|jgi:hypothetical protein|nr:MAG: hypothetical protein AA931_01605 [Peptococcaceae bacterium 1109]HHT72791.1 nucleoside recognition protein [Bacillota bacterium]
MGIMWEGLVQGLSGVWVIARIVIPLMILLEIAGANRILERLNGIMARMFRWIGLTEEGAFPVVVAVFFGLSFGSGVIISHLDEGKVSPREVRIIGVFMALCHALVEDTAIFLAVGVPLFFLLVPRLAAAYLCCWGLHRFMVWRERREFQGKAVNG